MKVLKLLGQLLIIAFLTALTQVGGLIWLTTLFISNLKGWKKRYVFTIIYLLFNLLIVPPIASYFGRERLPVFNDNLKPRNWFYSLAFRNYVTPELKKILKEISEESDMGITYLDASFPFYNGFPLLPHLSHNDGKKIDLSFKYLDEVGKSTDRKPSLSGYGSYVKSKNSTSNYCNNLGYWQYDFTRHLTFGTINQLEFDPKRTKKLIKAILGNRNTQKVFIEPYLKKFMGLESESKIRFHGCQAVRHDDHIHLQVY